MLLRRKEHVDRLVAMEAFVTVFETGSFSEAARQLHVGQPAISKTVAQLEDRLGVRLLLRSTRGLTPTEAGQAFYEHAKRAIDEADEADLAARGASAGLTGRLRVCAPVTFSRLHVVPYLSRFLDDHPSLEVDVIMDDRPIDLVEEGIDMALRMGTLADSSATARKIGQCRRLVVGTPSYFARAGEPKVPGDLVSHQAIMLTQPGLGGVWTFRQGSTEASIMVGGRVRFTAGEGVREAVLAGLGLTIGSEWLFAPELANGTVQPVLLDWSLPPVDMWAVFPTGRRASAKARAFATFVESLLGGSSDTTSPVAAVSIGSP
jgi:DNA-binding transcriptional LysR family regulator